MTTTPNESRGRPAVVDLATWQIARDELLVREKAHTRTGDALAAARRRMPMVEFDGSVEVVGRPCSPSRPCLNGSLMGRDLTVNLPRQLGPLPSARRPWERKRDWRWGIGPRKGGPA